MPSFNDRGILFVLSAPSGTGKSVITKRLLAADHELFPSISATTLAPRPHEVDTSDCRFVSEDEFDEIQLSRDSFFFSLEVAALAMPTLCMVDASTLKVRIMGSPCASG